MSELRSDAAIQHSLVFLVLTAASSGHVSIPKPYFQKDISTSETQEHTNRPPDRAGAKVSSDSYEADRNARAVNETEGGGVREGGMGVWRAAVWAAFPTHKQGGKMRLESLTATRAVGKNEKASTRPRRPDREHSHFFRVLESLHVAARPEN